MWYNLMLAGLFLNSIFLFIVAWVVYRLKCSIKKSERKKEQSHCLNRMDKNDDDDDGKGEVIE